MKEPNEYIIALGSNLGNREANLTSSIESLNALGHVVQQSSWLENSPVGFESNDLFLNGACLFVSELEPEELLVQLKTIEKHLGRAVKRSETYASRPIDLDIVWWNKGVYESDTLYIPHPRMHQRDFVLVPVCEVAPDYEHPVFCCTMKELYDRIR